MENLKAYIDENVKWKSLDVFIRRIETFKYKDNALVLENSKALLESIFKTILVEVKNNTEDDLKNLQLGQIYREIKTCLNLQDRGYENVIGSFSSAISTFRNKIGEISHGKDIYTMEDRRKSLEDQEIKFLLQLTDNISFFILSYYETLFPKFKVKKPNIDYLDYEDFNSYFDDLYPKVSIGVYEFLPSEILFNLDINAYKEQMDFFLNENTED